MSKKKPIATINEAHEGEGECWISAVRAMKNTDLFASGMLMSIPCSNPVCNICGQNTVIR